LQARCERWKAVAFKEQATLTVTNAIGMPQYNQASIEHLEHYGYRKEKKEREGRA